VHEIKKIQLPGCLKAIPNFTIKYSNIAYNNQRLIIVVSKLKKSFHLMCQLMSDNLRHSFPAVYSQQLFSVPLEE